MLRKVSKRENLGKIFIAKFLILFILINTIPVNATEKTEEDVVQSVQVEELENQANEVVGKEDMVSAINENSRSFIPNTENIDVIIPKAGNDTLTLASGADMIEMELPKEVSRSEGILSDDGYVIYTTGNDFNILVQTMEEEVSSVEQQNSVRTMISISNADAPKEYSFEYNLPNGYQLILGSELGNSEIPDNAVGIINEEGYAVAIIDSPWARDANGKELDTEYSIEGTVLTQKIKFDEFTAFPILADPTTIVDTRIRSKSYTKTTDWHEVSGQPAEGYAFYTGGSKGWYTGVGTSRTMSFEGKLVVGNLSFTYKVGSVKKSEEGELILVDFPPSKQGKKIIAKHKFKVIEKVKENKYKTTKITDNGKTTTTTYKWVAIKHWIDDVIELKPEFDLKVVS